MHHVYRVEVSLGNLASPLVSQPPECLTCDNIATDTCPAYSPDGTRLAYLSMATPGYESDRQSLKIIELNTMLMVDVTAG